MQVAQRGDVTGKTATTYGGPDRWELGISGLGTHSISQSSTAPDGFSNSYKVDCTTADASPAAGDFLVATHKIEAQNLQHIQYGSSGAQKLTLSFYVRSNKTGTYVTELLADDPSRIICATYTISSADTWEFKKITFNGDTAGTGINDDNGVGLFVNFWLGAGSTYTSGTLATAWQAFDAADRVAGQTVNIADNTANEWMITGVQLEVGSNASDFEHRSFGEELALCQRYFQRLQDPTLRGVFTGLTSGGASRLAIPTYTKFRANPTISLSGTFSFWNGGDTYTGSASTGSFAAPDGFEIDITINSASNTTKGMACASYTTNSTTKIIDLDAEI
jgi:hypothetical protein